MKIGCYVSMSDSNLQNSANEALSYGANAFMVYTGSPQSYARKALVPTKITSGLNFMNSNNMESVVIHASFLINLASYKDKTWDNSKNLLRVELDMAQQVGAKYLVLHPGNYTDKNVVYGVNRIAEALNEILRPSDNIIICLETMAGKGTEVGFEFDNIQSIIERVNLRDKLGICMDTCHMWDAGYDWNNIDEVLEEFDAIIGLDQVHVIHLNNSLNDLGSKKDRHSNLIDGKIPTEIMYNITRNDLLKDKIFILESKDETQFPKEIAFLKHEKFNLDLLK